MRTKWGPEKLNLRCACSAVLLRTPQLRCAVWFSHTTLSHARAVVPVHQVRPNGRRGDLAAQQGPVGAGCRCCSRRCVVLPGLSPGSVKGQLQSIMGPPFAFQVRLFNADRYRNSKTDPNTFVETGDDSCWGIVTGAARVRVWDPSFVLYVRLLTPCFPRGSQRTAGSACCW